MTRLRAERIAHIQRELPALAVDADDGAELLVLGWGSSYGAIRAAARRVREPRPEGRDRPPAPPRTRCPPNVGALLRAYPRVLVPEMNSGQLAQLLRAALPRRRHSHTKITGRPLFAAELEQAIVEAME